MDHQWQDLDYRRNPELVNQAQANARELVQDVDDIEYDPGDGSYPDFIMWLGEDADGPYGTGVYPICICLRCGAVRLSDAGGDYVAHLGPGDFYGGCCDE